MTPADTLKEAARLITQDGYNADPRREAVTEHTLVEAVTLAAAKAAPSPHTIDARFRAEVALGYVCDVLGVVPGDNMAARAVNVAAVHPGVETPPLGPLWALGVLRQAHNRAARIGVVKMRAGSDRWPWIH